MEQNTIKVNDIVEDVNLNLIKSRRDSGIELFRIISMIIIVAHHYVVNSGLIDLISARTSSSAQDVFLLIFGWGKNWNKLLCINYRLFHVQVKYYIEKIY